MSSGIAELEKFTQIPLFYGTKLPATKWKYWVNKKPPEAIKKFWFPENIKRNKALLIKDNLAVIDFDDYDKYWVWKDNNPSLSNTLTVKTNRAFHCYFYVEQGTFHVNPEEGIDIKTNGIVVLPPSKHVNGTFYEFVNDNEIITVPDMEGLSIEFTIKNYKVNDIEIGEGGMYMSPIERCVECSDLIGELSKLTTLKRSGNHWKALCPFHDDHHPSLSIWDDHFFCFTNGCWANKKRDIVDLVARENKVSIKDAIAIILGEDDGRF